MSQYTKNLYR